MPLFSLSGIFMLATTARGRMFGAEEAGGGRGEAEIPLQRGAARGRGSEAALAAALRQAAVSLETGRGRARLLLGHVGPAQSDQRLLQRNLDSSS